MHNNDITVYSFNCRSLKSSIIEIHDMCDHCDFLLVQEHWLLPNEISMLSTIHTEFLAVGHSAVDLSHGILIGRLMGALLSYSANL